MPNNGRLINGVRPKDDKSFEVVTPDFAWGTAETIAYLELAVTVVHQEHPDTEPLHVGHISKPDGGHLSPHLSHQSGRDVDLGFYYKNKRAWYRRATWDTFDTERNWTLVKALITRTDVDLILLDRSLQVLLRKHAQSLGEDKLWLHRIFSGSADRPAIIRHARGHSTHLHVRFFSPEAQRNAQRVYPFLLDHELVKPVVLFEHHRVRKGETLGRLAKRYGTTVQAIQQANGIRGTLIQARKVYKIPLRGVPPTIEEPLSFPKRELP
jgi:penicillin-insensitive murein endopeptidase